MQNKSQYTTVLTYHHCLIPTILMVIPLYMRACSYAFGGFLSQLSPVGTPTASLLQDTHSFVSEGQQGHPLGRGRQPA